MKPLTAGQIIALIVIGVVTAFYLSARNYRTDDGEYSTYMVQIDKTFELGNQKQLDIDLSSENIYISTGDTDSFQISYENYTFSEEEKKDFMERIIIKDTGDEIQVYKEGHSNVRWNFFDNIFFFIDNGFRSDMVNGSLTVVVPKDYDEDYQVNASSGNIDVKDIRGNNIDVKASSGNLNIIGTVSNDFSCTTSSGRITAEEITTEKTAKFVSSSGSKILTDINADFVDIKGTSGRVTLSGECNTLEANTSSGSVIIEDFAADEVDIRGSSGRLKFDGSADSAHLQTSSGNIDFATDVLKGNYDLIASSGTIRMNIPDDEPFTFESSTSSGDFHPGMDLSYNKDNDDYSRGHYISNNTDVHIALKSSSGNQYLDN